MVGGDLVVAGVVRGILGRDHRVAGPRGEASETLFGVQRGGLGAGDESLLGGLFGDAHALADVGPGGSRAAGLIDEVPDQVVGDLAQMLGGQHGVGELVQHVGVHPFDGVDQLVEADGIGDGRRFGHAVNSRLTQGGCQPRVDAGRARPPCE